MDDRNKPVLFAALVFVVLLGGLTLQVWITKIAEEGARGALDPLSIVSLVVLTMFGLAIWGAIKEPPER